MMKNFLIIILTKWPINKLTIKLILKANSISYLLAGLVSRSLENDNFHPKHRLMKYDQWFLNNIKGEWTILDVGCAEGKVLSTIAKKAKKVVGIEINPEKCNIAKHNISEHNVEIICGDALSHSFEQQFDAVILSNVLEHIEQRVSFLKKISTLTNIILIRVPMINRDWITLYKKEKGVKWKLNSGHFIEYTNEDFHDEISRSGLSIKKLSIQFGEIWAVVTN